LTELSIDSENYDQQQLMQVFNDVFISYGRAESKAFASKIHQKLKGLGLEVWFDQEDIPLGVDFQNQIDEGIKLSHNFVFIIAPHALKSPYCLKEIELAVRYKKRIIPILHVEPSSQEIWEMMHPAIGKINWIYARQKYDPPLPQDQYESIDDFENAFQNLLRVMDTHKDYVEMHTKVLAKAADWEHRQRSKRLLLSGKMRIQAQQWLETDFTTEQAPCAPTDLHAQYLAASRKAAENGATDVFFSALPPDHPLEKILAAELLRWGVTVWQRQYDIESGSDFSEAVSKGILQADIFLFFITQQSVRSANALSELRKAIRWNKPVIPMLIEATEQRLWPDELQDLFFIDLSSGQPDQAQIDAVWAELEKDADYFRLHKHLLVRSVEWKKQQLNKGLLLRGFDLEKAKMWVELGNKRTRHKPAEEHLDLIQHSAETAPQLRTDVYVSYHVADRDFAGQLQQALSSLGKIVWFEHDSIPPDTDMAAEKSKAIQAAANFLLIRSTDAVSSPECKNELEQAAAGAKRIMVADLAADLPHDWMQPVLSEAKAVNFYHQAFNTALSELVRMIDTDREHVQYHNKYFQQAQEWDTNQKSPDLLLQGNEFAIAEAWLKKAEESHKRPAPVALQKEFLTASREAIETARKREKRNVIRLRAMLIASVIMMGLAAVAGLWADINRREAEVNMLSFKANEGKDKFKDATRALSIAFLAYHRDPDNANVLRSLYNAVAPPANFYATFPHKKAVNRARYTPDAQLILTASDDSTLCLWANPMLTTDQTRLPLTRKRLSAAVEEAFFIKNGTWVLAVAGDSTYLFDRNGKTEAIMAGRWQTFSPDSSLLVTATGDRARVYNLKGQLKTEITHKAAPIAAAGAHTFENISFSPNGLYLLTASTDSTARLWSVSGKNVWKVLKNSSSALVSDARFLDKGERILTIAPIENKAFLWETASGELLRQYKLTDLSYWAVAPDGRYFLLVDNQKNTTVYEARYGQAITSVNFPNTETAAFAPLQDGFFTSSNQDQALTRHWGLDGALKNVYPDMSVENPTYSPSGRKMFCISGNNVFLFDSQVKQLVALRAHSFTVTHAEFAPNEKSLLSASIDNSIRIWDTKGQQLYEMHGHKNSVRHASFSPDNQSIVSASEDGTAKIWYAKGNQMEKFTALRSIDYNTDSSRMVVVEEQAVRVLDVNADRYAALAHIDGEWLGTCENRAFFVMYYPKRGVSVFNWKGQAIKHFVGAMSVFTARNAEYFIAFYEDPTPYVAVYNRAGKRLLAQAATDYLATDNGQMAAFMHQGKVHVWQAAKADRLQTFEGQWPYFSPNGQRVTLWQKGKYQQYLLANGQPARALTPPENFTGEQLQSPDGRYALLHEQSRAAVLYDLEKGQALLSLDSTANIYALTDNMLRYTHQDTVVAFQLADRKRLVLSMNEGGDWFDDCVRAPAGSLIVVTRTGLHWYDSTAQKQLSFVGHTDLVTSAAFSPDGEYLLTGSRDNTAMLWDATDGTPVAVLNNHRDYVNSVAFSPDGSQMLTASNDKTAKLWDTDGHLIGEFAHERPLLHATFSANGRYLICHDHNIEQSNTRFNYYRWLIHIPSIEQRFRWTDLLNLSAKEMEDLGL
jgi:WD40 repeat protein